MIRLAAFDMDGTLVDVDSSWRAVHDHFGLSNDEGLRAFLDGRIDDLEFIRSDVRLWHGREPDLRTSDLRRILASVPLMPGAAALFAGLRERRVRTAIVSGGLDLLAERIGRELGVDRVLANGVREDADGRLTGEGIVRVPIYEKERVLQGLQGELGIRPDETLAVGNSEIDIGLFHRAAVGVAFQPADQAVRRAASHVIEEKDLRRVLPLIDG